MKTIFYFKEIYKFSGGNIYLQKIKLEKSLAITVACQFVCKSFTKTYIPHGEVFLAIYVLFYNDNSKKY